MKSIFFHLRKQIKLSMPDDFGIGKSLQPSSTFNINGTITFVHGDFDSLMKKLQMTIGQAYVIVGTKDDKNIKISRITDINH